MSASRGALAALVIPWVAWMAAGTRVEAQVAGAMDVWPRDSTVELGGTKQFGAYVPINPNTIRWLDRKSTRLNSSHIPLSRMPSSA